MKVIIVFDYIFVDYNLFFILHYMWGIFHHACAQDALLHAFVIFSAVDKRF
jgi:hypothetical protein